MSTSPALPARIVLHQPGGRTWGMPNLGPFCIKLETYLRMAGWTYEWQKSDFRKAPKGKIPYVALDDELMGDSQLILERLEAARAAAGQATLDGWLDDGQRAAGHALRRMLEEGTYFLLLHLRWVYEDGWRTYQPKIAAGVGPLKFLLPLIRRNIIKRQHMQGTGRHSPAEIDAMAIADLRAAATLLGSREFLCGDRPTSLEATLYAMFEATVGFPQPSAPREFALSCANLMAYRARVRARWWSDLPAATA